MHYSYSVSGNPEALPVVTEFLGIGFLLIGIIVLLVALAINLYKSDNEKVCTVKVRGKIINDRYVLQHPKQYNYNGGVYLGMHMFAPYHYMTVVYIVNNEQIAHQCCIQGYKGSFHVGQNVDVWYNPANPLDCRIKGKARSLVCLCLMILGILFTVFGLLMLGISKGVKL